MSPAFFDAYMAVMVFLVGACVGSFLNVCIHRIPREESVVAPRSRCPHCGGPIAWYDNLPILSWLLLRARCRRCGGAISARYALVELLTAVLFWLAWRRFGIDPRTPVYLLVLSGLILGTFVDLEHMIIPDRVTLGGIVAGLALSPLVPALHGAAGPMAALRAAAIGVAAGAGGLYAVAVLGRWAFGKEAMGLGDVKLLGAVGAFFGWPAVLFTIVVSSFLGTLAGVGFILAGRKAWGSRIPYGPYLAVAAALWMFGGDHLWQAYVDWLRVPPG